MSCSPQLVKIAITLLTLVVFVRVHEADEYIAARTKELENREAASRAQIDEALNQLDARCYSLQDMVHLC